MTSVIDTSNLPPLTPREQLDQLKRDAAWVQRYLSGDHIARREMDSLMLRIADEAEAKKE